jgi:hypothetical protein
MLQPHRGRKKHRIDLNKANQTSVRVQGNRNSIVPASCIFFTHLLSAMTSRPDDVPGSDSISAVRGAPEVAGEWLLVTSAGWVIAGRRGIVRWTASRATGTYATRRRRATSVVRAAAAVVHVGVVVATRRWAGPGIVRIVRVSCARWAILIRRHAATRRRTTMTTISSLTSIVEFARRGAATVVIPARAVTTRRTAAIVVIIIRSGRVAATAAAAHRRTRSVPVTGPVIRTTRASIRSPWLERWGWRRVRDVLGAGNFLTLELTAVQLLNGSRQIGGCLVFDETSEGSINV